MSIKRKIITTMLIVSVLPINVFAASPQTKQMIHDVLSKFCIPPKKENCNPREEGKYDPNYNFCLCEDDGMVYSKSGRKCVECRAGTYYRKNMKDNSCKFCPSGEFQPYSGQSECKKCNSNACYEVGNNRTSCDYKCGGGRPHCNGYGSCVECTNDSHCNYYCVSNSCVRCRYDSDCRTNYSCSSGSCVCDITESDCDCGMSGCGCKSCPEPERPTDPCGGCPEGSMCNVTVKCSNFNGKEKCGEPTYSCR